MIVLLLNILTKISEEKESMCVHWYESFEQTQRKVECSNIPISTTSTGKIV